jgi:hypothetical protein
MVRGCKSGDYRLQGKIHPRDFDYTKNTHLDLPVDPKFKGKSMDDVLLMRRHGHLAVERFIPANERKNLEVLNAEQNKDAARTAITSALIGKDALNQIDKKKERLAQAIAAGTIHQDGP